MGIRIVHGNGDLIGAAAQGVSQGVENFQAGQQAQADRARAEQVAANLREQLRMDQEAHDQGVKLFNQEMFDRKAAQNWQSNASKYEGPNKFKVQRETLMATDMDLGRKRELFALIDEQEKAEAREFSAMGIRGRIGEVLSHNQDYLEMSTVAQGLMDPAVLEQIAPEDLPEALQSLEEDLSLVKQQFRDQQAAFAVGQQLNELSSNPTFGYEMQAQLPRIIEGMADRYPPQVLNNALAGITGKVPMAQVLDGGQNEAAVTEILAERRRIQEQAHADAANRRLGGGATEPPPGGDAPELTPLQKEVQFRKEQLAQRTQRLDVLKRSLDPNSGQQSWEFVPIDKKYAALREFRAVAERDPAKAADPEFAAAFFEKHGLDPNDAATGDMLGNAASLPSAEFNRLIGSVKDVDPGMVKKAKKELERLEREVHNLGVGEGKKYTARELLNMIEEASKDPTGKKWDQLPSDARYIRDFFMSPEQRREQEAKLKVASPLKGNVVDFEALNGPLMGGGR